MRAAKGIHLELLSDPERLLHGFILLIAVSTLLLLCAGALVTGTGSGLAVPDWPLSFGQLFPPMVGGVLYEHGHRMAAGTVALLICLFALLTLRLQAQRTIRRLASLAVAMVLIQAVLGGMTVLFGLPTAVSVAHACLAQCFFCTVCAIAWLTSTHWRLTPDCGASKRGRRVVIMSAALSVGFFVQLLLGAIMRHRGAALAIPDFPTAFGAVVPPVIDFPIAIHLAHRWWALAMVIMAVALALDVYHHFSVHLDLQALLGALFAALSLQILLGAFTIWLRKPLVLTTLHLAGGALCLAFSVLLCMQSHRIFWRGGPELPVSNGGLEEQVL